MRSRCFPILLVTLAVLAFGAASAADKPNIVVIWGDDQFENFRQGCIPAFCIYIFNEIVSRPLGVVRERFDADDQIDDCTRDDAVRDNLEWVFVEARDDLDPLRAVMHLV